MRRVRRSAWGGGAARGIANGARLLGLRGGPVGAHPRQPARAHPGPGPGGAAGRL